jgi:hypothetical protein
MRKYRIEEFKSWVARNSDVPEQHYIALTAQGKPVRFQALFTEVSWSHETAGESCADNGVVEGHLCL